MAAPKGNQNARAGRAWRDAVNYVLAEKGRQLDGDGTAIEKGLRSVARKFVEQAEAGEAWALKELGDRVDGKAAQAIDLSGQVDVPMSGTVKIVKSDAKD